MFNTRPESIRNLLRKEGIAITNKKMRHYPRDSHYFDIIDTPDKAYWLGMFYADGTLQKNTNQLAIYLKDKEHIEKLKTALHALNHKIIEVTDTRFNNLCKTYGFTIRDAGLYNGLLNHGVMPNKSYELFGLPKINNINLMRHFIRGYYDGDGGLSYSIREPYYRSTFTISFTGNKQFLEELKTLLGLERLRLSQNSISKITYQFTISGRQQVLSFLEWLYQDSTDAIRLDRKYNKYIELLNCPAHNPRTSKMRVWPTSC